MPSLEIADMCRFMTYDQKETSRDLMGYGGLLVLFAGLFATQSMAQTSRIAQYAVHPQIEFSGAYTGSLDGRDALGTGGFGLTASYRQPLDRIGIMAFRIDGVFASFGSDGATLIERPGAYDETEVDVVVDHSTLMFDVGLQLQVPRGILRPYVAAMAGAASHISSIEVTRRSGYGSSVPDSANVSDNTLVYSGVAGILLMTSSRDAPVFFNAGFKVIGNSSFETVLAQRAEIDYRGELFFPRTRMPHGRRFLAMIGVTFTLR